MLPLFRALTYLAVMIALLVPAAAGPGPQYVLVSFDGAHDLAQWKRSRALADSTGARFTYFLSCVFLLSRQTRQSYRGPAGHEGRSNVGFAHTREEVGERLAQIWLAREEGHEIASHGCGHFDGKDWSAADWQAEFAAFLDILTNTWQINELSGEPAGWREFVQTGIVGFRAPYLSLGPGAEAAIAQSGLLYDASTVSRAPEPPVERAGVMRFALPMIAEGPRARPVLAMDYNLYVRHSRARERPEQASLFEERAYEAFVRAFEEQYHGARAPLQIGFHFTLMNGGAYWRALERFLVRACGQAEVVCVGYRDYLRARLSETADG